MVFNFTIRIACPMFQTWFGVSTTPLSRISLKKADDAFTPVTTEECFIPFISPEISIVIWTGLIDVLKNELNESVAYFTQSAR